MPKESKGINAIKNPLSGQKVTLAGKEYDRGKLSPEINAMIDEIAEMQKETQKASDVVKRLEGAIMYVDQKLGKAIKDLAKGQEGGSNGEGK